MKSLCLYLIIACLSFGGYSPLEAQSFKIKGTILGTDGEPVQFAHLYINADSTNGTLSNINGRFEVHWSKIGDKITVRHVDHLTTHKSIRQFIKDSLKIVITPRPKPIKNDTSKTDGLPIIERLVANDRLHDPEKQGGSFRYTTYNKSTVGLVQIKDHKLSQYFQPVIAEDSLFHKHHRTRGSQHVEVVESITERYFHYPHTDHEKIIGIKESGLHDSQLIALHSNQYSLSLYDNYYNFLGIRYVSPIGPETYKKYTFVERDRFMLGRDTIFVIAYEPIKLRTTGLRGLIYINSNQYAVQNIIAKPQYNALVDFQISQEYEFVDNREWFPTRINHLFFVEKYPKKYLGTIYEKNTYIKDIELDPDIDKSDYGLELVLMDHYATEQNEEFWEFHRVETLSDRDIKTYLRVDTLRHRNTAQNVMDRGAAFFKGNLHYKLGHLTLHNLFGLNRYEGLRLGLGGVFGKDLLKVFEVSGYGAYGFHDEDCKWGVGGGFFLNEKKEMELKFLHTRDLDEPGHIDYLNKDKDIFRTIFTDRMDRAETNQASFAFRSPDYHLFEFGLKTVDDVPAYDYQYSRVDENGTNLLVDEFHITEFVFSTRYAINEKISNMFGDATRFSSFSPIFYLNYSKGFDQYLDGEYDYHKWSGLMEYQFHIGHIGTTNLTLDGGWINGDIPYPFLFNGKGGNLGTSSVIIADHFQTMGLYEFVSDQYVNLFFSHNFGSSLFAHARFRPDIVIYQNIGWGKLSHPERHISTEFLAASYPDGYMESGLGLNNAIKFNFFGKMYGGLGLGFFYRYGPHASEGGFSDNFVYRITYVLRSI